MSDLLKDPMVLRQIIMDHYEYPRNHTLTKEEGYAQKHMASTRPMVQQAPDMVTKLERV